MSTATMMSNVDVRNIPYLAKIHDDAIPSLDCLEDLEVGGSLRRTLVLVYFQQDSLDIALGIQYQ